ncbi:MAG: hypothetical protein IJZ53_03080 [Tyzzerella sp.]|nr:hypothetical protein [Tyzzerella sp.]
MKEKLYTIPMMDALRENDECPFCYIERNLEQHALDFVLSSSAATYMQDDVRAETDAMGFCRDHYQKMFTYGNLLGNSKILETHMKKMLDEMKKEMKNYSGSGKQGLMGLLKKDASSDSSNNNVSRWIHKKEESCYVCNHMKQNYDRYIATFLILFKRGEKEFVDLVKNGKGYCLHHLADIMDAAPNYLNEKEQKQLRDILFPQMEENVERIIDELEWLQKKFDYRYKDEDWKNSRDSVQRAMQKLAGGYPADEPYQQK